ncbi:MAG: hypothetical protein ACM3JK_06195 [Betaproteobacteria bacterium]
MLPVLFVALAGLADTPVQGARQPPTAPAQPSVATHAGTSSDRCPAPNPDSRTIVICTQRQDGYRLNPDILEAKRETRSPGAPVRPGGKGIADCEHVGPAPCIAPGIDLIGAALTAVEMAQRAAKGQEIGSMFVTDPQPSEYQRYQMAKARREAEEAAKAAQKAKAAARAAEQGTVDDGSSPQSSRH